MNNTLRHYSRPRQKHIPSYDIAAVHAALGDSHKTIAWLDRACADHNMKLFTLAQDPRFEPVRKLPEFKHLINQIGLGSTVRLQDSLS